MQNPRALIFGAFVLGCLTGGPASAASEVTYQAPTFGGYRLDWCRSWGQNCGGPAAYLFCRSVNRRYIASKYAKDEDIGGSTPTKLIGSGQICNERMCDGFKFITCVARPAVR